MKHDGEKGVFDINSYDINTGETETILQTQINENLNLITAKDDVMYFTHTINDGTAIKGVSLKSYNVTTKEQKTIAVLDEYIDDSYGLPVYATGETAYFSSNEFSSIYKVDLTNGQIVTLSDSWPDISAVKNPEPNYILNGKRYLNQLIKDENGDDILLLTSDSHGVNGEENIFETYQFNTKTKEFTKNTLKSYFKGSERSIILYGQQRNLIFGVMESYPITVTENYKGTVSSWISEKHNYGFITVDDYLNSRANYKIFKPIFDVE